MHLEFQHLLQLFQYHIPNIAPLINNISNVDMQEGNVTAWNLTATDENAGDVLTWDFQNLPGFITKTINGRFDYPSDKS